MAQRSRKGHHVPRDHTSFSAAKWLGKCLPNPASLPLCSTLSVPIPSNWPPWVVYSVSVPIGQHFDLLPQVNRTVRIYSASDVLRNNPDMRHYCLMSADFSGMVGFENGPLPKSSTAIQAAQITINSSLSLATLALCKYSHVEIIASSLALFCFTLPGK